MRTVVDNMSVAGTKAASPEMLENALEHEILHEGYISTVSLTWFYFGKFET